MSFAPVSLTTLVNNTSPGPRNFSQRSGGGPEGSLGHLRCLLPAIALLASLLGPGRVLLH